MGKTLSVSQSRANNVWDGTVAKRRFLEAHALIVEIHSVFAAARLDALC